jgi:2,4-dienoyl-CoA reductase (NADPH2)
LLAGAKQAGERVAIIGAGGIGFDVAGFLTHAGSGSIDAYLDEWGIDRTLIARGGLVAPRPHRPVTATSRRKVYLLQRKAGRPGAGLGKTTGWIHRAALKSRGVLLRAGVTYRRIDDHGLHLDTAGGVEVLDVDHVIICAGQESVNGLVAELAPAGKPVHVIGGALLAAELDAERAIREAVTLGARL